MIGIYGIGTIGTTPSGLVLEENFRYGTVYNIWDGGATYIYGNDVVIFKEGENSGNCTQILSVYIVRH